jgi:hypothetical protein
VNDNNAPLKSKNRFAAGIAALVSVLAFVGLVAITSQAPEAEAMPSTPLEVLHSIPMYNSAGDAVFAEMYISDDTGVVVTPPDAGVFTAISGAPLVAGASDGSGCLTGSITTGLFTVAKPCGRGKVHVTACVARAAGSSNTGGTTTFAWVKNGTVVARTTAAGAHRLVKVETVDAGNAYSNVGCAELTLSLTTLDTIGLFATNAGGGVTATVREAAFRAEKIYNE